MSRETRIRFPVGGSRQAVYDYLRGLGFVMGKGGDKFWTRADNLQVHVYGVGSKYRLTENETKLVAEGPLDELTEKLCEHCAKAQP